MLGDDLERVEEHPNEEPQHARAPALAFGREQRRQHEGRDEGDEDDLGAVLQYERVDE